MNLLKETIEDIAQSGHTIEQIVFIGSRKSGHQCTWAEFVVLADHEYYDGYGAQEVASDLEIVFSDGSTMTRGEYDGLEWWTYSAPFTQPGQSHKIGVLFAPMRGTVGWCSLSELNPTDAEVRP